MALKKHRHVSIVIGKVNVVINEINEILLTKILLPPFSFSSPKTLTAFVFISEYACLIKQEQENVAEDVKCAG